MGRTKGENDPLVDLKKQQQRPEAMTIFLIVICIYGIFATVTVLRGTRALVYLKTKLSTAATPQ